MEDKQIEAFRLRLQNGQTWDIVGYGKQCEIVRNLARLMNLQNTAHHSAAQQLIFVDTIDCPQADYKNGGPVFSDPKERVRIWCPGGKEIYVEVLALRSQADQYFVMRMGVQMIHHLNSLQGGLPLHCALAELDGAGIILAARSGTGKTTCCQRFPAYWKVLGDDEALISKTKIGFAAHAIPTWSHYLFGEGCQTWQTEYAVPVRAVFFLKQAEQDGVLSLASSVGGVRLYGAVNPVYHQFWKDLDRPAKTVFKTVLFNNACDISRDVPVFVLQVSRDGRFWQKIEEALS